MGLRAASRIAHDRVHRPLGAALHVARRRRDEAAWSPWNPFVLYRGPVTEIRYVMATRLTNEVRGRRLSGSWDLERTVPLTDLTLYRGLRERFAEGRAWEDTVLHPARYHTRHENEPRKYFAFDLGQLLAHGRHLDHLYRSLLSHGFRAHREMGQTFSSEMSINIGRGGELIRNASGLHRLIICHLAGITSVPTRVLATHFHVGQDLVPLTRW
jgi:hypothetical protein